MKSTPDSTDEMRRQEGLADSETLFRAFVTAISDVVYRMSPNWTEMRYLEGREFIADTQEPSRTWLEKYIPPDEQVRVSEAIERAIRNKSVFELEHRVYRWDGTIGWTLSRAVPILGADGDITEWFGAARDVTGERETQFARERAERTVRRLLAEAEQQRRLYDAILSSTPDLVYVFDLNHRLTYANRALLNVWGVSWDKAIGKNCLELGYEACHAAMHDREIDQVIATKQPIRGEMPFTGTSGRRVYDYIFVPVIGDNGDVTAIAGTTRDITERTEAELRLARTQQKLADLIEHAPFGIYVVDSELRIAQMNLGSQNGAFKNVRPLIGRHLSEAMRILWPEPVAAEIGARFRHTLETGEPFRSRDFMSHRNDLMTTEAYEWELHRVIRADGTYGVVCYYFDSSQLRNAEAALRRANQDLEQFAYSASHDLQEPVRMVKIYTQMLSRRYGGQLDSQGQQCLNEVIEAATRMEILLRDLLEYSRAGDLGEAAHPENAEAALEAALANLKVAIAESGARIQSDQLPVLPVLSTHLQQLFQNLIGNAIKYRRADATPEIYVHAWREGTMWYFSVSDNGIGIEQQFTDEIFGLFKRLHRREEYSGTGIGLAICQRIVERYGGRIWVESKPGEGSIFYFTLPA